MHLLISTSYLGPQLPFHLRNSTMITSPSGDGVILIGGFNATYRKHSDLILEFNYQSKVWTILEQKLKYPRELFVAMYIPTELTKQRNNTDRRGF